MTAMRGVSAVSLRHLRALWRQPSYLFMTLAQPLMWLLLFSQLFKRVSDIPGFGHESYVTYLMPGIVVMTAMMSAGWSGMTFVEDIDRGILPRLLATPVWRGALGTGLVIQGAAVTIVQSAIVIVIGLLLGATIPGGAAGLVAMLAAAMLLAASVSALSNAFALVVRQREPLIGAVTMVTLPLTFVSTVFMEASLLPGWMQTVSRFNPVNWAAVAARTSLLGNANWGTVATNLGLLAVLVASACYLSAKSFGAYLRVQ